MHPVSGGDESEAQLLGQNCQVLGDSSVLLENPTHRTAHPRPLRPVKGGQIKRHWFSVMHVNSL